MFMLTSLINVVAALCTALFAIMGYQYEVEGYGLHPMLCIAGVLVLCIAVHYLTVLLTVRATYAYNKAHPQG